MESVISLGLSLGENIETVFKVVPPIKMLKNGYGFLGVVLRDIIEDKLQCHTCGKWFKALPPHIAKIHGISDREYKIKYGLPLTFPLVARSTSLKLSKASSKPNRLEHLKRISKLVTHRKGRQLLASTSYGRTSPAALNKRGLCEEQVDSRFLIVADMVGKEPTVKDIKKYDPPVLHAIKSRYGTINIYRKNKGYEIKNPNAKISDEHLLASLRSTYHKLHKIPRSIDQKNPGRTVIIKRFGSWNRALVMAGLK